MQGRGWLESWNGQPLLTRSYHRLYRVRPGGCPFVALFCRSECSAHRFALDLLHPIQVSLPASATPSHSTVVLCHNVVLQCTGFVPSSVPALRRVRKESE